MELISQNKSNPGPTSGLNLAHFDDGNLNTNIVQNVWIRLNKRFKIVIII